MFERMKKALGNLPYSIKAFFPGELEQVLKDQAAEIDRLRADYAFIRSQIMEGK
jgi:hypothetical protein